ncbi:MAG: ABC transporter permease [Deltaproteobacteria bacterium]|jgi:capsular polysaccharide transport system permease protein|nr:ABC transporter permease [Deltaproteobacteria bacterium]
MANPFSTTLRVWQAIFLQEALVRLFGVRAAWAWLVVEPAAHIGFMSLLWVAMRRGNMDGADLALWIAIGMLAFFLFRRTAIQAMHAIDCNKPFFAFRQVRPFDAAFVRAGLEAFLMVFISLFIFIIAAFTGRDPLPHDPLLLIASAGGLWLFGLGYGMTASVIMRLAPETTHILEILMMPLYLISGTIIPLSSIPLPYRDWLLVNPLAHGLESARASFFATYHVVPGVSLEYLCLWALCSVCLGLALYRVYETRLVMQ